MTTETRKNSSKSVRSRLGIFLWIGVVAAFLYGGGGILIALLSYIGLTPNKDGMISIFISLFGLFCLFMGFALLQMKAKVTKDGLKTWLFSATREVAWSEVEMVTIPPGGSGIPFLGWNIAVAPKKKQGEPQKIIIVPTALFNNGTLISKAIIEAAVKANPDVIIDDVLLMTFGKPPYGVFDNL